MMNDDLNPPKKAPLLRFSDAIAQMRADADAAHEARTTGQPRGPITGLPFVDREISSRLAPGLHGLNGNSGAGKTAFALQAATSCRFPALYVTCEMSPAELLRRHTARVTKTYLGKFTSGELTGAESAALAEKALSACPDMAFLDATTAPASRAHIEACALATKGDAKHVLIVIDSLHSWAEGMGVEAAEYETINMGLKSLREMASTLSCPILFIAERNRSSMDAGGLNAGAGSRKIEYGAETVFSLDRDMKKKPDASGDADVTLTLVKNRHGAIGRPIELKFNGALQTFRDLSEGSNR